MPITQYSQIRPGLAVSIVLKADQKTGRQVQGTVSQLLTRHNHPRGIKVKLTDGRVGRVQHLLPSSNPQSLQTHTASRMTSNNNNNNPWQDAPSQGNPFTAQDSPSQQGAAQSYYNQSNNSTQQQYPPRPNQAWQQQEPSSQQHQQQLYGAHHGLAQPQGNDQLLVGQGDRAEQIEHMQQYEASAPQSQADLDQAQLQKEFPNIDGSLIAAIYNERPGNLGEVRELLQELNA
ncbi:uncharacterized protein PV06_10682 [Exophiala oligosperma]|uniref:Uncharacterized protein n=1 Tax=Exophiala oligosperma TaxID=215243 RepID=A0A0D2D191_9EURO|nr:uncharacterized protein PV06_10682 [Exophiala oligosperma]KIW37053.1 hypothetical protein PV06_10682 [Exophiala oligosperma]